MFKNIFDLKFKRTGLQAVGFYIAYLVLLVIVGAIAGAIAGVLTGDGFEAGLKIGHLIAILACLSLGIVILKYKRAFSFGNLVIVLLAGVLAIFGGGFLGLMPVSFLTTKPSVPTGSNE